MSKLTPSMILLFSAVLSAQVVAPPQTNPAPASQPSSIPPLLAAPSSPAAQPAVDVPPSAAVITLHGLCPDQATDAKSPACQTVITRSEFEHLTEVLSPTMSGAAKQSLANDYARMLVISSEARKRGLEKTGHFKELVNFVKLQVLAQELFRSYQEQAKPSAAEVEKYYNDNVAKYEELSLKRLFIPRNRPDQVQALQQPGDAAAANPKPATDAELQASAEKLLARLVAGEDFEKLQKEVYESAGYKTPPPPSTISNWRKEAVPTNEQQLFELKAKEFSKIMMEPAGAYIYQIQEKKVIPFAEVKPQIESTMTNERLHQLVDGVMAGVKPEMNQAYFSSLAASSPGTAGMQNAPKPGLGANVPPKPAQSPTPKTPPSTATKPK